MKKDFVLIIAGPPGVGKTTLSKIICQQNKCSYFSGDETSKELFPGVYKDTLEQLQQTNKELLKGLQNAEGGDCIVVDLVSLDEIFIKELKNVFRERLIIKVIFPPVETIISRDKKRQCWTSGEEDIKRYYKHYQELKEIIGEDNYINNSNQKPEETVRKLILNKL